MKLLSRCLIALPLLAVCALGCGPSTQNAAKFSGRVTYNGRPVTGGNVVLHSKAQGGTGGNASLDSNGRFETTNLPLGDFDVTIETEFLNPDKKSTKQYDDKTAGAGTAGPKYGGAAKGPAGGGSGKNKMEKSPMPDTAPTASTSYMKIPDKYTQPATSGLSVTLKGGSNSKDFELTD